MIDSVLPSLTTKGAVNLLRDAVSIILSQELASQKGKVTGEPLSFISSFFSDDVPNVYNERAVRWDVSELNAINIYVDKTTSIGTGSKTINRRATIIIDVATTADSDDTDNGASLAQITAMRMLDCISEILMADQYKTLGFVPSLGFIGGIDIGDTAQRLPEADEKGATYIGGSSLALDIKYNRDRLVNATKFFEENYTVLTADNGRFSVTINTTA